MLQRLVADRDEARAKADGVTLIELLMVIVILGILAASVMLVVGTFHRRGQEGACKANFKTIENAVETYRAKNSSYPSTFDQLVPDYLREPPASSEDCTITLTPDGTLTASGAYTATSPPRPTN